MPIDWLAVWGVTQATGLLLKPVLEDLAVEVAKDMAKDKIKDGFGVVFKAVSRDTLTRAYGKALTELLQLIQDELIANDVPERDVEAWNPDVKLFVRGPGVEQTLRRAFGETSSPVDAGLLAQSWRNLADGPHILPNDFDWSRLAKLFSLKVRKIREEDPELRDIPTQAAVVTAEALQWNHRPRSFTIEIDSPSGRPAGCEKRSTFWNGRKWLHALNPTNHRVRYNAQLPAQPHFRFIKPA